MRRFAFRLGRSALCGAYPCRRAGSPYWVRPSDAVQDLGKLKPYPWFFSHGRVSSRAATV